MDNRIIGKKKVELKIMQMFLRDGTKWKTSWVCRATLEFNYRLVWWLGLGWVGVGLGMGLGLGWIGLGMG